jgi:hypothetical protein
VTSGPWAVSSASHSITRVQPLDRPRGNVGQVPSSTGHWLRGSGRMIAIVCQELFTKGR